MPVDKQIKPAKHVIFNGHSSHFSSNEYEDFETPNRNKMANIANPKSLFNLMKNGNLWQAIIEANSPRFGKFGRNYKTKMKLI